MNPTNKLSAVVICAAALFVCASGLHNAPTNAAPAKKEQSADEFRGAMITAEQATASRLRTLKASGIQAVALQLHEGNQHRIVENQAAARIAETGFDLYYWIEVARSPELADAHPDWMASLQGHPEWRRLFKNPPTPNDNEVVKTYPWVPILNKEAFDGQLKRIQQLLADRPQPKGLFLNDLQGSPSACGCGNHLCRWTTDYGKRRTATPIGNEAPGKFVAAVKKLLPDSDIIPVWTTECEEHDGAPDGLCAGVGCFKGICWKAYTQQLMPVAQQSPTIGLLAPYRAFDRDLPLYGEEAGWITYAVKTFADMPPKHGGTPVKPDRVLAVLQGWDVTPAQIEQQIKVTTHAGVTRYLISYAEIEQAWEPRIAEWK